MITDSARPADTLAGFTLMLPAARHYRGRGAVVPLASSLLPTSKALNLLRGNAAPAPVRGP